MARHGPRIVVSSTALRSAYGARSTRITLRRLAPRLVGPDGSGRDSMGPADRRYLGTATSVSMDPGLVVCEDATGAGTGIGTGFGAGIGAGLGAGIGADLGTGIGGAGMGFGPGTGTWPAGRCRRRGAGRGAPGGGASGASAPSRGPRISRSMSGSSTKIARKTRLSTDMVRTPGPRPAYRRGGA